MGTGIVGILLRTAPHKFRGMADIGTGFYLLDIVLFVVFTALSIARYGRNHVNHVISFRHLPWCGRE